MATRAIVPDASGTRDRELANLLSQRIVPARNAAVYERAQATLQAPTNTASRDERNQAVVDLFKEFAAGAGRNALPDTAPVPSRIRQQVINRIHARLLSQTWAMDFGDAQEIGWGEQLAYRTTGVKLPKVYKIGAPGGNLTEVHKNADNVYYLGQPAIYTTPEIFIPRFNPMFPDRYLQDLAFVADMAAIAMLETIEADALTALNAQFTASGMRAGAFDWMSSRVVSGNIPDTNIVVPTTITGNVDHNVYKAIAKHVLGLGNRTIAGLYGSPAAVMTQWNGWDTDAGTNSWRLFPEAFASTILRDGQGAWTRFFGMDFPAIKSINSIVDGETDKFLFALLEPTAEQIVPRGAFWFYTWPAPEDLGPNGAAYIMDNLQYLRTQVSGPVVYDVFVLQKNAMFASVDYQKPNCAKIQFAT